MRKPRAPVGYSRSSSPSLPNSTRFWIGKPISLTCESKVDALSLTRSQLRRCRMRSDIVPGAIFPDYELSDHTTKHRKLSELQGQHPMVLVLSRGGFCPKDRRQAELLLELHREIEVVYCRLVTISTDNVMETDEYRTGVGAHWPFLRHEAYRAKGSRYRRIYRSPPQSDDPSCDCPRARPYHL